MKNRQKENTYLEDLESSSDDNGSPGPGNYDLANSSTFKQSQMRRDIQFFGSSEQRFKKSKDINQRVGPGAYNLQSKSTYSTIKRLPKFDSPFITAEQRFSKMSESMNSPGPGKYNIKSVLMQKVKKRSKKLKNTSFGTMQKRRSVFDSSDVLPGPADYDGTINETIEHKAIEKQLETRNSYGRVIPRSSSMFLSSVKRNMSYIKQPY